MKKIILSIVACVAAISMNAQCLDWINPTPSTGWNDFNNFFGGAPVDTGSGCPFNEIQDFEVFASEAYSVDNFVAGTEYTFSICNGPNAGTWVPEFTILSPGGNIDAFGPGDGCSITWTATESGTYLIVINEAGACGGGSNTSTSNGFPALTCTSLSLVKNQIAGFDYFYSQQDQMLSLNAEQPFSNIELYNIMGQRVMSQNLSQTEENINLSSLNTGVYLANVNVNGKVSTFKIVKK